jgi:porin
MVLAPKFKLLVVSFVFYAAVSAQKSVYPISGFSFHATYTGDLVSNFRGGIKSGSTYLGLLNLKTGLNTTMLGGGRVVKGW